MAQTYPNFAKMKAYVAPDGVRWHRRGDTVLVGKSLARRVKKPEVRVVHHRLGNLTEVMPGERVEFWAQAERRMATSNFSDLRGSEFRDDSGHYLLIVDESC